MDVFALTDKEKLRMGEKWVEDHIKTFDDFFAMCTLGLIFEVTVVDKPMTNEPELQDVYSFYVDTEGEGDVSFTGGMLNEYGEDAIKLVRRLREDFETRKIDEIAYSNDGELQIWFKPNKRRR